MMFFSLSLSRGCGPNPNPQGPATRGDLSPLRPSPGNGCKRLNLLLVRRWSLPRTHTPTPDRSIDRSDAMRWTHISYKRVDVHPTYHTYSSTPFQHKQKKEGCLYVFVFYPKRPVAKKARQCRVVATTYVYNTEPDALQLIMHLHSNSRTYGGVSAFNG